MKKRIWVATIEYTDGKSDTYEDAVVTLSANEKCVKIVLCDETTIFVPMFRIAKITGKREEREA